MLLMRRYLMEVTTVTTKCYHCTTSVLVKSLSCTFRCFLGNSETKERHCMLSFEPTVESHFLFYKSTHGLRLIMVELRVHRQNIHYFLNCCAARLICVYSLILCLKEKYSNMQQCLPTGYMPFYSFTIEIL